MDQERRVAVITGAGSRGDGVGNGRAIAALLARDGMDVVIVDRVAETLVGTEALVAAHGDVRCVSIVGDVTDAATCAHIVDVAERDLGRLDVLVNNVGIFGPEDGVDGVDASTWGPAMHVNVTSMALMCRSAFPAMQRSGGGSVINIASVAALAGTGTSSLFYATSKGAVVAMTRQLASRHGRDGIRVNCVAPGMVETPMVDGRGDEAGKLRRRMAAPLRTPGTAWDVGEAVAFLAGDRARWISGVVLPVDGGLMAVVPSTEGPWPDEL